MTDITERIAEILDREPVEAIFYDGADYISVQDARRLAEVLVSELGLEQISNGDEWWVESRTWSIHHA